jgi:hypothetical protein
MVGQLPLASGAEPLAHVVCDIDGVERLKVVVFHSVY